MEQMIFYEKNSLWYEMVGDYYIPCLTIPEQEGEPVGRWGRQHRNYLREHKDGVYTGLLLSRKLDSYLRQLNDRAENMFLRLVKYLAEREGITEKLKTDNPLEWTSRMNNILSRVTENVDTDLIFT